MLIDPTLFVEQAVEEALVALQGDRTLINDWYGSFPAARQSDIVRFFESWVLTPESIKPALDKEERTLPTISVLAIEGAEIDWNVGGSLGVDPPGDGTEVRDQQGSDWSVGAEISVFALSQDQALYLRLLVIGALLMYRDDFDDLGLRNMKITYGRLIPDTKTLAAFAYRYTVTVTFQTWMVVPKRYGDTPTALATGADQDSPGPFLNDGDTDDPPSGYSY